MGKKALILVDLQNDFCEKGALAVPDGDAVIEIANQIHEKFETIVVTKDWHPLNHLSFAANHPGKKIGDMVTLHEVKQILWPTHCVQHTLGAKLHPALKLSQIDHMVHKGTQPTIDSYSAFFDNEHLRETDLADYLNNQQITDIYIMGLALDYCVKYTCLDALSLGFTVYLIQDGCRGVEWQRGDIAGALTEMRDSGAHMINSTDL